MFGKQKAQIAGNDSSSDISRDVFTELGGLGFVSGSGFVSLQVTA